jgi:hypothetical protein
MKKGNLKSETIKILKTVTQHLEGCSPDYDNTDMKYLLAEARMYYELYLYKKENENLKAEQLEQMIVPKYEIGLRAKLQEYLDEV